MFYKMCHSGNLSKFSVTHRPYFGQLKKIPTWGKNIGFFCKELKDM